MKVDLKYNTFKDSHPPAIVQLGLTFSVIFIPDNLFIKLDRIWDSKEGIILISWLYLNDISDILRLLLIAITTQ